MSRRLNLSTASSIQKTLARITNMVLNGEINSKDAGSMIYACNTALGAIKVQDKQQIESLNNDEQIERINLLKAQVVKCEAQAEVARHEAAKLEADKRSFELLETLVEVASEKITGAEDELMKNESAPGCYDPQYESEPYNYNAFMRKTYGDKGGGAGGQ